MEGAEQMRELPILFSTDMVRAILEGRKTMTRRVVKENLIWNLENLGGWGMEDVLAKSPFGVPGGKLYVREQWWVCEVVGQGIGNKFLMFCDELEPSGDGPVDPKPKELRPISGYEWGSHPSIHMPKKFARIWLEVLRVKVQRIQDITEEDAKAEGCPVCIGLSTCGGPDSRAGCPSDNPKGWFRELWNSLNFKRGYEWEKNPFCWVVEFKMLSGAEEGK